MTDELPIGGEVIQHSQKNSLPLSLKILRKQKVSPTAPQNIQFPTPGRERKCNLDLGSPLSKHCQPQPAPKKTRNFVHQPDTMEKMIIERYLRINIQKLREKQWER